MAQQLFENEQGSDGEKPAIRKQGKVTSCAQVENGSDAVTLNGQIRILHDNNSPYDEFEQKEIFFYAAIQLQLEMNDLISFEISYFDDGRPYANNIKIVKYGGIRHTAHIEALSADIFQCSVFTNSQSIDVGVDGQYCVNAVHDALCHGSQIEFSLDHDDERSNLWTAKRIILLNKKKKRKYDIDVDDTIHDLVDINLGQMHDNSIMDRIPISNRPQQREEERKLDPNDRYLIANNPADIVWIEKNERKFKTTKSSINYDMRIYIDVPFEADDALREGCKKLNELRPLNQFDRVSDLRRQEIIRTQQKCLFLWLRYWCCKIIQRRTALPSFIKFEQCYQAHFAQVMSRYIACNIHSDEDVFAQFMQTLKQIAFVSNPNNKSKAAKKQHVQSEQKSVGRDEEKNKKKKKNKKKQPHTPLWDCYDRWATQNILKYYNDTLKEIDYNTNMYINAKNDEALKQAARCLNKLRPKYSAQINALSQDALFKINYWKRNAHFCLVRCCVRRCIEQRLAVPRKICNVDKELKAYFASLKAENVDIVEPKYADDAKEGNSRLLQLDEYTKIKEIVVKFDGLYLDAADVEFDNLLIECSEIVLNVPDDILGIDKTEFKQNIKIAQIQGKGNSVYITDKSDGGRWHRIYFFSPFLAYKTHPLHVQLQDISPQLYKMCKVFEKNQHLLFLDMCIPWKILQLSSSLNVSFHYQTDKGWIMTPASNKLENNSRGFYCIHKQTQTESLLGSFSRMFKKFTSNEYSAQKSAETAIVQHLLSDITDWGSYRYSRMIMNSLNIFPEHYKNIWKQQLKYVETKPNLVNVHKLQLLKSINPKNLPDLEAQHIFFITRACLGEEKSVLLENEYNQQTIGIAIYNSFVGDLRRILNYVPSHMITTSDRICLFPSFNFFRYFQDLKERINEAKRQQQRQQQGGYYYNSSGYNYNNYNNRLSDYELKRVDFNKDMEWIEENMVDVLDVDLRIAMFQNRPWPLETIILNFCKTLKKNDKDGTGRMIEIFARLSTIKASQIIFRRIFNNTKNVNCIFYLLHIDFVNWIKFCHCIGEAFIKKNKRVHRIFIERLQKKIEALQNMQQLNDLLGLLKEFKILNRLVIRMKLLRNISLLETAEWREAVDIIMQIVWKHARIDEDNADMLQHCTAELLFNLLKRENQREFGLKLFISPPETEMDEAKLDAEEDDLYASSEDELTVAVPVITSLDDDDTKLAIALSQSEAETKRQENEAKIEEKDDAKDDEKELISVKEREMNDIERIGDKKIIKTLAVVAETAEDGKDDHKEKAEEKEKAALPIVPRRKKKKKKKEKAKLVNKVHVFEKACMEALEQILMTKNSIPDKIAMFCGHEVFYELPESMHVLYVDLVLNGANKDLAKWGVEHTLKIKQISMQYATVDHAKGVTLWELLLDKLIHLPLDMVVAEEYESEEEVALSPEPPPRPQAQDISHLPAFLQQLILQQGRNDAPVPAPVPVSGVEENVSVPPPPPPRFGSGHISGIEARQRTVNKQHGKRAQELQNEFLEQISYCISCQPWIEFAMEMKHLFPMGNLLKFINNKLDKLQMEMSYHTLSMLCADLLRNEEQRFKKLLVEIKHRMCYDDEVDAVILNYRHWYKLREHLIIMFRRYIKIDDTAGKDIKELNHFLEYLKQWNHKSIMDIDEKSQWKFLQQHEEVLNVLNQRQESKVFLRLWYDKRLDIEREQKALYERYRIKKNIVQGKDDGKQEQKPADDEEAKIVDLFGDESGDDAEELYVTASRSGRKRFHFQHITRFEWSFELYMTELFAEACDTWDTLVTSVSNRKLKIADLDWFIDLELSKELKIMKLPGNVINKVHLYAGEALKLQPLLRFTSDLVQVVQLIVEYMRKIDTERVKKGGKTQCNIVKDKNWKGLVKKLESGRKLQRDQPIADAAKMYEDVSKSIGIDFSKLHRNWLSTLLSKKHIVVEMATNADFADTSRFEEMLRLLDDANNAMMAQLSGALRSVKRLLRQNLLDQSFPHYTALMRYLAGLSLREQDLTDLAQVGDSLQNIQRVVEDAGKTAAVRDMKILASAMKHGYFLFMNQVEVQEQIDLAQHFDADQIGRNCLQLHSGRILYSCEQVENMIDRILLCRRNTEHNVQKLVKKLEICREINSLRVLFTRSGGREEGYGDVLRKKKLVNKKRMLQRHKLRQEHRKRRLIEKKQKDKKRIAKIKQQMKNVGLPPPLEPLQAKKRLEVVEEEEEQANNMESSDEEQEIKINDEELKELEDIGEDEDNIASYLKTPVSLKLADYDEFSKEWLVRVTEWNSHVEILRSSSALMNYFTINNVRTLIEKINRIIKHAKNNPVGRGKAKVKAKKSGQISGTDTFIDGLNPDILQRHILPHFQFVNPRLQVEDLIKCLKKWKVMDESCNTALTAFDKCFKGIIVRQLHDTKQFTRNVSPLEEGKPNLVVTARNTALFTALKMYLQRKLIPNAEHILICQNTSSAEEIEAMIFRCIHATTRHSEIPPLYCLIYPEDLDAGVLDATINIFNNRLLSPRALEQTSKIPYAFSVISADSENRLSQMLVQFKLTQSIQLQKEECTNLLKYLFHDSLHEFVQRYNPFVRAKPFVELYTSKEVGMGKSYVIQQKVKLCGATYIRIPFNGDDIDLDFLVDRCWSYHSYTENLENDMEKALVMDALSEADKKDNNAADDLGEKVKKVSAKYAKLKSASYDKNAADPRKIIYHLDISANAGEDLNNMLFNLLFLRHIHTPNKKCFSVDDNMAFLIEIPTELSGVHALNVLKQQKTAQNQAVNIQNKATLKQPSDVFYLLYKPMEFPSVAVSNDTNLFHYDYDCHYAGKFLRSFYGNELKQNDPDPSTVANMTDDEIHALIYKHFQNIAESSPIHYKAFFKFLSQQFTQVVNSIFLRNEFNDGGQIAWKHWVTSSIIDIGKDFCRRLYGGVVHKRRNGDEHKGKTSEELIDESTGKEHFYLCERWKNAREPMFLLNQTCDFGYGGPDGSISALVSDKYTLPAEKRTALENSKFILIPWNEERRRHMLLQTNFMHELPQRKQEKINLFLRILGLDVENNVIHQSILISLLFEDPF